MADALTFRAGMSPEQQAAITALVAGMAVKDPNLFVRSDSAYGARAAGTKDGQNVLEFYAATDGLKRDGNFLRTEGISLDVLRSNPRFMFAHKYGELPVGNIVGDRRASLKGIGRSLVLATTRLRTQGDDPWLKWADLVFRMYENHDLDAVSFGWHPQEVRLMKDRAGAIEGVEHLRSMGLELSACSIPVDPACLQLAQQRTCRSDDERELLIRGFAQNSPLIASLRTEELRVPVYTIRDDRPAGELVEEAEPATRADGDASGDGKTKGARDPEGDGKHDCKGPECEHPSHYPDGDRGENAPPASAAAAETTQPAGEGGNPTPEAERALSGSEAAAALRALAHAREAAPASDAPTVGISDGEDRLAWNRAASPAFDVAAETFEPATAELDLVSRYLDCAVKTIRRTAEFVPTVEMGSYLTALDETVAEWRVDDVRNLTHSGAERPPVYETIQLNSTRRASFLVDGLRFMRHDDGRGLVLRVEPDWGGIVVTTFAREAEHETATGAMERTATRAGEINFLRGEAFSLSGEFLARGTETWDDLFLTDANAAALQRIGQQLNAKGAQLPNRGELLMGPPGTGKTTIARTLMREAPDATFIWVSARDFWRLGAMGGLARAFAMARRCVGTGGTILTIEDVDNWLDERTVDLVKTEMDGIVRGTGVVTVMTTNFPERLPQALIDRPGRFHDVLNIDLPNAETRGRMIARWMPDLDEAERSRAVAATDGMSGAHVRELASFAAVLREEQAELDASAALTRAIEKLTEQRELISATQLRQCQYVPTRAVLEAVQRTTDRLAMLPTRAAAAVRIEARATGADEVLAQLAEVRTQLAALTETRGGRVLSRQTVQRMEEHLGNVQSAIDVLQGAASGLRAFLDDTVRKAVDAGDEAPPTAPTPTDERTAPVPSGEASALMARIAAAADRIAAPLDQRATAGVIDRILTGSERAQRALSTTPQ